MNMRPKVILHNSVSIDGSYVNFEVDIGLHYQVASNFGANANLIGSSTAKSGLDKFGNSDKEEEKDFEKPDKADYLPYWIIADSKGILEGYLHSLRKFEYCRDVVVLITEKTPQSYVDYLKKRNYDHHISGSEKIDFGKALPHLAVTYRVGTLLVDAGKTLGNLLVNEDLVDEISLLVHPVIAGDKSQSLFSGVIGNPSFTLVKSEVMNKNFLWLLYKRTHNDKK